MLRFHSEQHNAVAVAAATYIIDAVRRNCGDRNDVAIVLESVVVGVVGHMFKDNLDWALDFVCDGARERLHAANK